jgi:hypothetical protein
MNSKNNDPNRIDNNGYGIDNLEVKFLVDGGHWDEYPLDEKEEKILKTLGQTAYNKKANSKKDKEAETLKAIRNKYQ